MMNYSDDKIWQPYSDYLHQAFRELEQFFETQPRFGPENQNLMDMLRSSRNGITVFPGWPAGIYPQTLGSASWAISFTGC